MVIYSFDDDYIINISEKKEIMNELLIISRRKRKQPRI
jgi:hypothetical protein